MTTFVRLIASQDRAGDLLSVIRQQRTGQAPAEAFELDPDCFAQIPKSPFAYWVSDEVRALFKTRPRFESKGRTAKQGLATADDFRFVRLWWEVDPSKVGRARKWVPFAKGGKYSPYYSDVYLLVNWLNDGAEIRSLVKEDSGRLASRAQNVDFFFRPGLTWPRRTTSEFSIRALPAACVFADKGPAVFVENDPDTLRKLALTMNASAFRGLLQLQVGAAGGAARSYEVGIISRTPVAIPEFDDGSFDRLVATQRIEKDARETSHGFRLPRLALSIAPTLGARAADAAEEAHGAAVQMLQLQADIDSAASRAFGLSDADRAALEWRASPSTSSTDESEDDAEEEADEPIASDVRGLVSQLLSWCAGVAFGRFDVRLATGERPLPPQSDPFEPLPVCSPGMLTGNDGLPLAVPPLGYPIDFPVEGILVDDPGHPSDLLRRIEHVFSVVFAADARRFLDEAAGILEPETHDLRVWLRRSFFAEHLAACSMKPRVAPVFWRLAAGASYSVWLDMTRASRDTLYKVLTDFVRPRIREEEQHLAQLREALPGRPTADQRSEYAAAEEMRDELRRLEAEIDVVAPLWNPDRNDGVILNFALLHRLVMHHLPWRSKCTETWRDLREGLYDWSTLAMRLWPENVIRRCAKDRSIAIAHGLETQLWHHQSDERWAPRKLEQAEIEALIQERTTPAVKEALARFEQAPAPTVMRTRRPRHSRR